MIKPPAPVIVPVIVAVAAPVPETLLFVKRRVSFRVVDALMVTLFVVVLVPVRVIVASAMPVASKMSEPPVPLAIVRIKFALFVKLMEPTVIAAPRLTVAAAVRLSKVALAPTAFGKPDGVQLAATFQL